MTLKDIFLGNKKRSQTNLEGPPTPVIKRSKTPILPLGTYTRPTKLEDWDPANHDHLKLNKKRLHKRGVFFSPDDIGHKRETSDMTMNSTGTAVYEMADTSILSNEMADTSIRAGNSSENSSSDEDSDED
jgi:hypothetical protein